MPKQTKQVRKGKEPAAHSARQKRSEIRKKARKAAAEAKRRALKEERLAKAETRRREVAAGAISGALGKATIEGREASKLASSAQVAARKALRTALRESVRQARRRLRDLKTEQAQGRSPNPSAALAKALARLDKIEKAIDASKAEVDTCKRKITEAKRWYEAQPEAGKAPAAWAKLLRERNRHAKKLTEAETRRTGLESKKLAAQGQVELARAQLAALDSRALDGPPEEDPRLGGLEAARAELESQLREAQAALGNLGESHDE